MWEQIRSNQRRSIALIAAMAALLFLLGHVAAEAIVPGAGPVGLAVALVLWLVLALVSYYSGGTILLAVSGARRISKADNPRLYNVVEEMQLASGLATMPEIYVIDDPSPNAFAAGRDPEHAAVAVTSGLLKLCNRDELQGVIAHEMAHVRNHDVLLMIMVGVMLGAIVIIADGLTRALFHGAGRRRSRTSAGGGQGQALLLLVAVLLAILAPIIAQLIYFAISRRREYLADASAVQFTRYPEGLASALEKIAKAAVPLQRANRATAPMYISSPFGGEGSAAATSLSATHPPLTERIRILRSMAGGAGYTDYESAFSQVTGRPGVLPASALLEGAAVPRREPGAADDAAPDRAQRARETTDMLWRLSDYRFISCPCGVTLKVPPAFRGQQVACPKCRQTYLVQASP